MPSISPQTWISYQEREIKCFENAFAKKGRGWTTINETIDAPFKGIPWLNFTISAFEKEPDLPDRPYLEMRPILFKWIDLLDQNKDKNPCEYERIFMKIIIKIKKILAKSDVARINCGLGFLEPECDLGNIIETLRRHAEYY